MATPSHDGEATGISTRTGAAVVAAIGCALALTAIGVGLAPGLIDTTSVPAVAAANAFAACSAMLVAYLVHGRFRQSRLVRHAIFSVAMLTLALSTIVFAVVPEAFRGSTPESAAPVLAATLVAVAFGVATLLPPWRVDEVHGRRAGLTALGIALAVVAASAALATMIHVGGEEAAATADSFGFSREGWPLAVQAGAAALFVVAVIAGVRRAREDNDALVGVFAIAAVFAAASRIDYSLAESPSSRLATAGSLTRLAFYAVLIAGAGAEIRRYWLRSTEIAVLEERRRIARELHDGLAQELAFVATQSRAVAIATPDSARARRICAAAERALDESRRAIAALTRPIDEPLDVALAQTAEEVAARVNARLSLDLHPVDVKADVREAVLRIAREAITNAGRHGEARRISVRLANSDGILLEVVDNGRGFDLRDTRQLAGKFGLVNMQERAAALGGYCTIESRPYGGTSVTMWLP